MKKHAIRAMVITALLAAGGTARATEGVEIQQNDPYANAVWNVQATGHFGASELDQRPGDTSQFSAQDTVLIRGTEIGERPDDPRNFTAQPTTPLRSREARTRQGELLPDLCGNRLVRLLFEIRDIELNCP